MLKSIDSGARLPGLESQLASYVTQASHLTLYILVPHVYNGENNSSYLIVWRRLIAFIYMLYVYG